MKITTECVFPGCWTAVDADTYDGPGCRVGRGETEQEAIADLLEQAAEFDD